MTDQIVNIVICYNNEDEVIKYAKELSEQTIKVKLVVVINKIGKKGILYLKSELLLLGIEFEIYDSKKNVGYLNGLLFGYKNTKLISDWYVLSNTDIKIDDKCFFENFLQSDVGQNEEYWLVGPSVYAPAQNKYSNPYFINRPSKRFYSNRILVMRFPKIFNFIYKLKQGITKEKKSSKVKSCDTYAVHGSYMFLKKELLDILIEQKSWELLFDEEQYIAEIVRKYKHKVFYDSTLEVIHLEGTSTGKVNSKSKCKLMIQANRRILKEFY